MAQLLPLQKYEAIDYNGLVTDNHFHALYMQKPELISTVIKEIYKVNLQGKLREFVDRFPVKEVEQLLQRTSKYCGTRIDIIQDLAITQQYSQQVAEVTTRPMSVYVSLTGTD